MIETISNSAEDSDLTPTSQLLSNRYLLHQKIGEGGMGAVNLATDRLTGKQVALKQVHIPLEELSWLSQSSADQTVDELRLALTQEFQILAGLRHPNIISVLDYGFDGEQQPFYTMAYLPEAQTILEAASNFDLLGKIDLVRQILQALTYLHRQEVLHRDLKPNNILYSQQRVRVVDFGLASYTQQNASSGGTLLYMAPEILAGQDHPYVQASDLYAVGVILYQMLAGEHPFDTKNGNFARQVLNDPPDLEKLGADEPLAAFVGRLLSKTPTERYPNAAACLAAFYEAVDQPAPPESRAIRESFLQRASFVGRTQELATIEAALDAAAAGQGGGVLMGGESGIGKTRLLDEVRIRGLVKGAMVLSGQASVGAHQSYQLWRDAMRRMAIEVDLTDLEASILKELVPDMADLVQRPVADPPKVAYVEHKKRLFSTIQEVLKRYDKPILLILEDLQWAEESLEPLSHILSTIAEMRLLIVASYRSEETPVLPETLPEMQSLLLERLTETEIADLGNSMLGAMGREHRLTDLIVRETEGNTFFIVEAVRALAEDAGGLDLINTRNLPDNILTQGMESLLHRRLERVPEKYHALLTQAAIGGKQIDLAVMQQLTPDALDIEAWLVDCSHVSVLVNREQQWEFAHDKLREALLMSLASDDVRTLNRRMAESIETVYPENRDYHNILQEHWHHAGDLDKEVYYLIQIVEYLIRVVADYEGADSLLAYGRKAVPETDPNQVILCNMTAQIRESTANYKESRIWAEKAQALAQQLGDKRGLLRSLLILGWVERSTPNYQAFQEIAQQCLVLSQEIGDGTLIGDSFNTLGAAAYRLGQYEESIDNYRQSLDTFMGLDGDHQAKITRAMVNLALVYYAQGNYEQAKVYYQQALEIAEANENRLVVSFALRGLGMVAVMQEHYESALVYHQQSLDLFQAINQPMNVGWGFKNLGVIATHQEDYTKALDYYHQSLAIFQTLEDDYGMTHIFAYLGFTYLSLADTRAQPAFYQALTIAHKINAIKPLLEALVGFAFLDLQQGDAARAKRLATMVQTHPSLSDEIQRRLDGLTPLLEQALKQANLSMMTAEYAEETDKTIDLDDIVQELLCDYQVDESWDGKGWQRD